MMKAGGGESQRKKRSRCRRVLRERMRIAGATSSLVDPEKACHRIVEMRRYKSQQRRFTDEISRTAPSTHCFIQAEHVIKVVPPRDWRRPMSLQPFLTEHIKIVLPLLPRMANAEKFDGCNSDVYGLLARPTWAYSGHGWLSSKEGGRRG
jgi:hypothetical protein